MEEAILPETSIEEERRNDWREVNNYVNAMTSSIESLKTLPLSMRLLREAHRHLMTGVRGEHKCPGEIQKSFARLFAIKNLPKDWASRLLPLLRAYSHPRREAIVRLLGSIQPIRYAEFKKLSGLGETSFLRHFGQLLAAEIVVHDEDGAYSLAKPRNTLAATFLKAALA